MKQSISINGSVSEKDHKASSDDQPASIDLNQDLKIDERALIPTAQQGDLEAFNRLVIAYQDRVFTQAYYLLGDKMAAEVVVQEAFLSAYRSIQSFRESAFRIWLIRIVTKKCLDELCRRKSRLSTSSKPTGMWGEEMESPSWSADPMEIPKESLIRAEADRHLLFCLDCLSTECRTAIVLIDILDISYGEAAEIIGCPLATINSRLASARLQMQHFLQDHRSVTHQKLNME